MKSVSEQEWKEKAAGLAEWRKNRTSPPNLDLYKRIVSMVHVGNTVLDVGAGQCHLEKCLPDRHPQQRYYGIDPFPLSNKVGKVSSEELVNWVGSWDSVFMLSALDNVRDLNLSLSGLKRVARQNIVILTGIGIPPNEQHTVQVDRKDLTNVLGEPAQEIEISKNVYLFEWIL